MQPDSEDLKLKQEAIELANAGNYSVAEPLLRAYTERYPEDVEGLVWLAACVPPTEAVGLMDRILALEPNQAYIRAWKAQTLRSLQPPAPVASTAVPAPAPPLQIEPVETVTSSSYPYPIEPDSNLELRPEPVMVEEIRSPVIESEPQIEVEAAPSLYPYAISNNGVVDEEAETVDSRPVTLSSLNGAGSDSEESGPVSLLELLPDFEPLPDSAVVIPPPPPPAPPQVEPLPILDPTDWLARASSEARRSPEFSQEASANLFQFVDVLNKTSWPNPVKTGETTYLEEPAHRTLYNQGIELVRGWEGDWNKLNQAVQLFRQCLPPLGFAGAAEALVSASHVRERLYNPVGLVYAVFWADRALLLDPFNIDALVARSEATVHSTWRLLADITVDRLRLLAPNHPRRYAIDGWYEFLLGNRPRAIELLRLALDNAITPTEKNLCAALLEQVQPSNANPG